MLLIQYLLDIRSSLQFKTSSRIPSPTWKQYLSWTIITKAFWDKISENFQPRNFKPSCQRESRNLGITTLSQQQSHSSGLGASQALDCLAASRARGWITHTVEQLVIYKSNGIQPTVLKHTWNYVRIYQGLLCTIFHQIPKSKIYHHCWEVNRVEQIVNMKAMNISGMSAVRPT